MAFYWAESEPPSTGGIPEQLTIKLDPLRVAMRGTDSAQPRCVALSGDVGRDAQCSQYARRPSPCRELQPAWENGSPSEQCDRARARHGLLPLSTVDWLLYRSAQDSRSGEEAAGAEPA